MHNIDFNEESLEKCRTILDPTDCELPPAPRKSAVSFVLAKGKIQSNSETCKMRATTKPVKKKFFRGPRSNKPYKFKYHRVFQTGQPRPFDLKKIVTKSFVKALGKSEEERGHNNCNYDCLIREMMIEDEVPPENETEKKVAPEPQAPLDLFDDLDGDMTSDDSRETLDHSSNHSCRSRVDYKAEIVDAVVIRR